MARVNNTKPVETTPSTIKTAPPVTAPPANNAVAIPGAPKSKQQRLAELLEQYRRDQISPSDYHMQRAKILSEPQ
jgi:hypothetical protein